MVTPSLENKNKTAKEFKGEEADCLPRYFYGDVDSVLPTFCSRKDSVLNPCSFATSCNKVEEDRRLKISSDIQFTSVTYRETSFWTVG